MSEFCFPNSLGIIPCPTFRSHNGRTWIYLNCPDQTIPTEALDLHAAPLTRPSYGPTGLLLEGEWARDIAWNDLRKPWGAYIPLDSATENAWYLGLDKSKSTVGTASWDHYILPVRWLTKARSEILTLHRLCDTIRKNTAYSSTSPIPDLIDFHGPGLRFEERGDAEIAGAEIQRCALDHLGFLGWWTSAVSCWRRNLSDQVIEEILEWKTVGRKTRGVLVNLAEDWTNVNIAKLVENDVPVCYPWTDKEASDPRFTRLSPDFLKAYHEYAGSQTPFADTSSTKIPGLLSRFPSLDRYDEFGQYLFESFKVCDRDLGDGQYYHSIVDFQRWRRRHVPNPFLERRYETLFFFARVKQPSLEQIVYWRYRPVRSIEWLPLVKAQFEEKGYVWNVYEEDEESPSDVREIYKVRYAPRDGAVYNDLGELDQPVRSLAARLSDRAEDGNASSFRGRRHRSRSQETTSSQAYTSRSRSLNSQSRRSASPVVRGMSRARRSPSSDSTARAPSENMEVEERTTIYAEERLAFVDDLRAWGSKFLDDGPVSDISAVPSRARWNPFLIQHAVIYIEPASEVRMRLWANCFPGWDNIGDILIRAIEHGLEFRLGIQPQDLHLFRPETVTRRDRAASAYYETGFVDRPLTHGRGGLELYGRYRAELLKVLDRPHARAAIAMGGPIAWIAKCYAGEELIERYMSGPSIQVTVHQQGWLDKLTFSYAQADQLSPEEVNAIYGSVKTGDNDTDKTLWPRKEDLVKALGHYRGEWNPVCEAAYKAVFDKLEAGEIEPRTRSNWVHWLRSPNHGTKRSSFVPDDADFAEALKRISWGFQDRWNKASLYEITVPENWNPLIETEK